MDCGTVSRSSHQAIEHIQFTYKMTLAHATDRWVAAHLSDIVGAERNQSDACAATGRDSSRFRPGVSSTDNQNVKHAAP